MFCEMTVGGASGVNNIGLHSVQALPDVPSEAAAKRSDALLSLKVPFLGIFHVDHT